MTLTGLLHSDLSYVPSLPPVTVAISPPHPHPTLYIGLDQREAQVNHELLFDRASQRGLVFLTDSAFDAHAMHC